MRDLFIIECLNTKLFQSIVNELRRCDYVCFSNFDESEHFDVTPGHFTVWTEQNSNSALFFMTFLSNFVYFSIVIFRNV